MLSGPEAGGADAAVRLHVSGRSYYEARVDLTRAEVQVGFATESRVTNDTVEQMVLDNGGDLNDLLGLDDAVDRGYGCFQHVSGTWVPAPANDSNRFFTKCRAFAGGSSAAGRSWPSIVGSIANARVDRPCLTAELDVACSWAGSATAR